MTCLHDIAGEVADSFAHALYIQIVWANRAPADIMEVCDGE